MKFKVKISGFADGKIKKFQHTFETPEFEPKAIELIPGHKYLLTVIIQQNNWLDDNYHLVVEECERRFIWPIIGYELVKTVKKPSKKEQVLELLEYCSQEMSAESMAMALGTLHELWPNIKRLAAYTIIKIVFNSLSASSKITVGVLKSIQQNVEERFNQTQIKQIYNNNQN